MQNSVEDIANMTIVCLPKLGNGQFEFVADKHDRKLFMDAFVVITKNDGWAAIRQTKFDSPQWQQTLANNSLMSKMVDEINVGGLHSGASITLLLQNMNFLAQHGIREFEYFYNPDTESS